MSVIFDVGTCLHRNPRSHPLALTPPHRPDLEDLLHEQMMRTAIDAAVNLCDAAEAHEEPLMRLRRDVAVVLGQRRVAHQQQCLLLIAGDECSLTVADVEAAHLERLSAGEEESGDQRAPDRAIRQTSADGRAGRDHGSVYLVHIARALAIAADAPRIENRKWTWPAEYHSSSSMTVLAVVRWAIAAESSEKLRKEAPHF